MKFSKCSIILETLKTKIPPFQKYRLVAKEFLQRETLTGLFVKNPGVTSALSPSTEAEGLSRHLNIPITGCRVVGLNTQSHNLPLFRALIRELEGLIPENLGFLNQMIGRKHSDDFVRQNPSCERSSTTRPERAPYFFRRAQGPADLWEDSSRGNCAGSRFS